MTRIIYWIALAGLFFISGTVLTFTGGPEIQRYAAYTLFFVCLGVADILYEIKRGSE